MPYNGYADQDAFHAVMSAAWKEILSTPEARERHNRDYAPLSRSHAACDHPAGICASADKLRTP